jgi:hemerythrin
MTNNQAQGPRSVVDQKHRALGEFFEETRDRLSGETGRLACVQLRNALEAHFDQEESLYFPVVWKLCPDLKVELTGFIAQHANFLERLDKTVAHLESGALPEAQESFTALQKFFAKHELSENSILDSIS